MMKFFNFSDIVKYRWMVFGRCFLAAVGGFLIASISVSLIALSSVQKALATYTGLIISFIMWLLIIIYVFSVKSSIKAWWAILIILMVMATVNWGLKQWIV